MTTNNRRVTVIGAGLAGLSAAYDLHRAGWNVTVLEARDRVGGRSHSIRTFSEGLVVEGGGEYIEENHTRMIAYVKQFGLQLHKSGNWRAQAVIEIEKMFPGSSELIETTATVAWPNEPYTRGSYMALAPGQVTAHWKQLNKPTGRLFFAFRDSWKVQWKVVSMRQQRSLRARVDRIL